LTFHRGAIWGWLPSEFERTVERPLADADPFGTEVMDFSHALLAPAQDVEIDKQGRVRIPVPLRQLAGVEREVVINSLVNRLEIWDRATWEARFEESLKRAQSFSGMPGAR
jgi:MraZ protein